MIRKAAGLAAAAAALSVLALPAGAGASLVCPPGVTNPIYCTQAPPVVTTGAAVNITSSAANLQGTVNPKGLATTWFFSFGESLFYGNATTQQGLVGDELDHPVSAGLTGLKPDTLYHYRLVGYTAQTIVYGSDLTFRTASALARVRGSGGKVFKDVSVPASVKKRSRIAVAITLLKRGRVTLEIRKGSRKLSRKRFSPRSRGKQRLGVNAPSKPGLYKLVIAVKPDKGKTKKVTADFRVT
jgi:hypothetical protein